MLGLTKSETKFDRALVIAEGHFRSAGRRERSQSVIIQRRQSLHGNGRKSLKP